ncbi:histone-lysine N-methyltransferase SETMAR [Trichonephila clavipes]|nr:histone-lysine N-methyltransferase SETMAR [Trichonephila clavipes]
MSIVVMETRKFVNFPLSSINVELKNIQCPIRHTSRSGPGHKNTTRRLARTLDWPELANRRGDVFYRDNVRPHTSVATRQKIWELGWEDLMYPPYNPDLEQSDYYLFLALQNFPSDKKLGSREDWGNRLLEFLANKDQDFYERYIIAILKAVS